MRKIRRTVVAGGENPEQAEKFIFKKVVNTITCAAHCFLITLVTTLIIIINAMFIKRILTLLRSKEHALSPKKQEGNMDGTKGQENK